MADAKQKEAATKEAAPKRKGPVRKYHVAESAKVYEFLKASASPELTNMEEVDEYLTDVPEDGSYILFEVIEETGAAQTIVKRSRKRFRKGAPRGPRKPKDAKS